MCVCIWVKDTFENCKQVQVIFDKKNLDSRQVSFAKKITTARSLCMWYVV